MVRSICWLLPLLAGCAAVPPQNWMVSPREIKAYEVSLAADGKRLAVAWHGAAGDERDAIHLRYLDASGRAAGPALRLTDGARRAYEPSLQLLGEDALIAWYERDDSGALQTIVARFSPTRLARWRVRLSPDGVAGRNPVLRYGADGIQVAWLQESGGTGDEARILHARLDTDGGWLETPREVGRAGHDTWNLNAALDAGGTLHVVYDARWRRDAKEVQMLSIGRTGVRHALLSADDGIASQFPDLAVDGGRAALTWFDERDGNSEVYLYAGRLENLRAPVDAAAARITHTPGNSTGAYVAWRAGHIGLAWCDDTGGRNRVFVQDFDADGTSHEPPEVLTDGRLQALIPSIIPWRRGFATAWNERLPGEDAAGRPATLSSAAIVRVVPLLEAPVR